MTRSEILQKLVLIARRVFDKDDVSFDEATPFVDVRLRQAIWFPDELE